MRKLSAVLILSAVCALAGSATADQVSRPVRVRVAALADRVAEAVMVGVPLADTRARCEIERRWRTRCQVALCGVWFAGIPAVWYRGVDYVYRRAGHIHVAFGYGGTITATVCKSP